MKPLIIGNILKSFLKSYDEGACDNLSQEDQQKLLDNLSIMYSKITKMQEKTYTIEEASLYLNVTRQSIYNYTKQGKLHPIKQKGGVLQYKEKELETLKHKKNK